MRLLESGPTESKSDLCLFVVSVLELRGVDGPEVFVEMYIISAETPKSPIYRL